MIFFSLSFSLGMREQPDSLLARYDSSSREGHVPHLYK